MNDLYRANRDRITTIGSTAKKTPTMTEAAEMRTTPQIIRAARTIAISDEVSPSGLLENQSRQQPTNSKPNTIADDSSMIDLS